MHQQQTRQPRLAITMASNDGHVYENNESSSLPLPDPTFKFGVATPYTVDGAGATFFDTNETLPSAIDPFDPLHGRAFARKDSTVSGAGSDNDPSNINNGRRGSHQPLQSLQNLPPRNREQTLRPVMVDSSNPPDSADRVPIQNEDGGKPVTLAVNGGPGVAEARMRRLLHELDSIGLTDDMNHARNSHDAEDWSASSPAGHNGGPMSRPLVPQQRGPSLKYTRPEDLQRLQQMNQARHWQHQSPASPGSGMRPPYGPNSLMNRGYPVDAPLSASSEPEDLAYYRMRSDFNPILSVNSGLYLNQQTAPYLPQTAPPVQRAMLPSQHIQQGLYHPVQQNRVINSAAFPMPPRTLTTIGSPGSRAHRRPGTAGNDPPVSYYNTPGGHGLNPVNRTRFGSDQNLRERYLAAGPQQSPSMSGSQQLQTGLSPISPASTTPAMTLSSSGSRTNSVGSGALETPVEGNAPSVVDQAPPSSGLDPIKEKPSPADTETVETPHAKAFDKFESSFDPTKRRGSLDSGLMLKSASSDSGSTKGKGPKSPKSPSAGHNPFLGGGLSGGLMFGGLALSVRDERGNPPPYRSLTSSGNITGRSNSLRAGSIGGRSDNSGSSFGDGSHSKLDQKRVASPTVTLATAFVKEGGAGLFQVATSPPMTKAEKAAEKARVKAEKAAQKAEEARLKVEEEKDAKKNEAELKKKRKEEKTVKRQQAGDGLYGVSAMVRLRA